MEFVSAELSTLQAEAVAIAVKVITPVVVFTELAPGTDGTEGAPVAVAACVGTEVIVMLLIVVVP
jgi:hypothetical protein